MVTRHVPTVPAFGVADEGEVGEETDRAWRKLSGKGRCPFAAFAPDTGDFQTSSARKAGEAVKLRGTACSTEGWVRKWRVVRKSDLSVSAVRAGQSLFPDKICSARTGDSLGAVHDGNAALRSWGSSRSFAVKLRTA